MRYKELKHITCNEDGEQEVEIVYELGLFRWLFGMNGLVETYVGSGLTWYTKATTKKRKVLVSYSKSAEIYHIVEWMATHKR